MVRVWHIATHSTNIGDAALIQGLQATIKDDWGVPVKFIPDTLMEYQTYWGNKRFDAELVARINSESDMLLIGGGGMLDGGRLNKETGIAFNLPLHLFDKIKVPVVFYAVGHNLFPNQYYWHTGQLRQLLVRITAREDRIFSVRNDGTLGRLRRMLSSDLEYVEEIPDPGLYVPITNITHSCLVPGRTNILIQLAGDNPFNRFRRHLWKRMPVAGDLVLRRAMRRCFIRIAKALQKIAQDFPVNFILCPHLVRDFSVMGEFVACMPASFCRFNFNASETLRGTTQSAAFFALYRKADMVIGMRGHSVICGVGVGTPTIALSSHDKIKGFMNTISLQDRVIELNSSTLQYQLENTISAILRNMAREKQRLAEILGRCRKETKEFHQKMLRLVRVK